METGNKPRRRVGSFTLGLCLILAGGAMLLYYFWPGFDFLLAAKLSPLILVALGVEILLTSFRPEERRYDFLSVFLCLFLMAATLMVSLIPSLWDFLGPRHQALENSLSAQLEEDYYQRLKGGPVQSLSVQLSLGYNSQPDSIRQLEPGDTLGVSVSLSGPYESAEAFTEDCRQVLDVLRGEDAPLDWVDFEAPAPEDTSPSSEEEEYAEITTVSLFLSGPYQLDWSAQEMLAQVNFY